MKKAYLGTQQHETIGIGIDPAKEGGDQKAETVNQKQVKYAPDGDKIMAHFEDFTNIQESSCGFGSTEEEALADLIASITPKELLPNPNPYMVKIFVCEMIEDMPHELIIASLRSAKPFTKEVIENFIQNDQNIADIRKTLEDENMELKTFYIIANE